MNTTKSSDVLVDINTELITLTIKGSASHPSFPGVEFSEKEATVQISCDDPYELQLAGDPETIAFQQLGMGCSGSYLIRPIFFEQQRYELVIEPAEGHSVEFWHDSYNVRKNITPVGRKSNMLSGVINFGNEIGLSDLVVIVDGRRYLKLTIEVFPSKISYKDDYKALVADITAEVYNLVFDFLKKTYESYGISSNRQASPVEFFAIIRKIYDKFITAADMVVAKPHHMLQTDHVVLPSHKIKRDDNKTIRWIEKHPDQVLCKDGRFMVEKALAVKKYVTYDTNENRLTKYMLQSTVKRLEGFKKQYLKLDRDTDAAVITQIDQMISGIQRHYNTGFLKEVNAAPINSGMSLVFSMAPGYRDLFRCYLMLQHGLSITGSIFNVSVKDISELYEYWCFIKLNSLMKERFKLESQDIIKTTGNGLFVSLTTGASSRVKYRNLENNETITLYYNASRSKEIQISSATGPQKPDNVLKLHKSGTEHDYEYVFDAKYRIDPALDGTLYKSMYKTPGPQEDDINTMHRYRDAIVFQHDSLPYERTMFGAYVLFPYKNEEEYKDHTFYKSIGKVNIGALPFLPSATSLAANMLYELITDSPDSAFERATLPTGIEDRLAKVDWSKRDVLIGTFRSAAQFNACKDNNFYYIPADKIKEDDLPIHYVALFQTPRIFTNFAGIHYYGEVLRSALVRRRSIREIPQTHGSPDDLYYRFQVKKWEELPKPILPKESGFIHEFTNKFLLENSQYVPELLLRSEEEYRFYSELKRRTGEALNNNDSASGFELGDIKVVFDDGQIRLYKDGTAIGNCTIAEFSKAPNATFRRLQRYANINDKA